MTSLRQRRSPLTREPDPNLVHVGFDMDGVTHEYRVGYWNTLRRMGHPVGATEPPTFDENPTWDTHAEYGITDDDDIAIIRIGSDMGTLFGSAPPIKGSRDAMNLLYDAGHRITIITARDNATIPGRDHEVTEGWLRRWGFRYDTLRIDVDKTVIPTDVFIEDRVRNYDALEAAGSRPFLITYPYNDEPDARRRVVDAWHFARSIVGTRVGEAHLASPEPLPLSVPHPAGATL
jgi:hypothetical protein